jgi:hypothetical protein
MLSRSFVLFSPIDALSFLFVFPFDSAFLIQNFSGKQARLHLSIQNFFCAPLPFRRGAPPSCSTLSGARLHKHKHSSVTMQKVEKFF